MQRSEQLNELFSALSKAQGQFKLVEKDGTNPYFKSPYSTLGACLKTCRDALTEHGLTVFQTLEERDGKTYITTILGHSSGQFISSTLPLISVKQDPQSIGSAITYMRRYSYCAILGLASGEEEDDDGEKAMGRNGYQSHQSGWGDIQPSKQEIVEPRSKERDISIEEFVAELQKFDKSFDGLGLEEYLVFLSEKKNVPIYDIQSQALRPEFISAFLNGYTKWYEKRKQPEF